MKHHLPSGAFFQAQLLSFVPDSSSSHPWVAQNRVMNGGFNQTVKADAAFSACFSLNHKSFPWAAVLQIKFTYASKSQYINIKKKVLKV